MMFSILLLHSISQNHYHKVGFLDNYFITNNISKSVAIKDLYSCTSVVYRSTLTVLGHNFLAVDTNTLINSDDTALAQ